MVPKLKTQQEWPEGVDIDVIPIPERYLHVTMRLYTHAELVELGSKFRQKTKESAPAWLLRLWDTGVDRIVLNGIKLSKMASVAPHPASHQQLYTSATDEMWCHC